MLCGACLFLSVIGVQVGVINWFVYLMKGVVRVGDRTTGGGTVLAGSSSILRCVTGVDLKKILRKGFDAEAKRLGRKLPPEPLAVFSNAIVSEEFMAKQVTDFVGRLRLAVSLYPSGYPEFRINQYLRTKVGRSAVLDQYVNRPGYVRTDFGSALKIFFSRNPHIPKVPEEWGDDHEEYEGVLLNIYASVRRMTHSEKRFNDLKAKL